MKNEKWKMKNEKWKMKNEKWKMKNEKWKKFTWSCVISILAKMSLKLISVMGSFLASLKVKCLRRTGVPNVRESMSSDAVAYTSPALHIEAHWASASQGAFFLLLLFFVFFAFKNKNTKYNKLQIINHNTNK